MEKIKEIIIIDFDGTIAATPEPETGKVIYKEKTGEEYPHKGWWGHNSSLDTTIFDIQPIEPTFSFVKEMYGREGVKVFLLTGRLPKNSKHVEIILDGFGVKFDDYFYKTHHDTITFKLNKMSELLVQYPDVERFMVFEDREEHFEHFQKWGFEQKQIDFTLIKITK